MKNIYIENLKYLELNAHKYAFTPEGTFYWENFLVYEYYYNSKFSSNKFKRRWAINE